MDATDPPETTVLSLSRITSGDNPRRYFDRAKHEEMVASLKLRGMLQPILLRPKPEGEAYAIVAGERRFRAALEAFGPEGVVPVIIREMTDQEALEAAIDENDVRDDASETEQADAAVRVMAACGGDRAEAAGRLGWSLAKLDRRLALSNLSAQVKSALDERRIKVGHAELLAAVPGDKQEKALETILTAGIDVAKTRDLLMRVTQSLAAATFDKAECTTCPFNSASQRALFEAHIEDGHCTNPGCFQLKSDAVAPPVIAPSQEAPAADTGTDQVTGTEPVTSDAASEGDDDKAQPAKTATASRSKSGATAKSIADRTAALREEAWRNAVAVAITGDAEQWRAVLLVAAMSGTLPQIRVGTLTSRAGVLVGEQFPGLDFAAKIAAIRALSSTQADNVLATVAAAYARDAAFANVAEIAQAFDVDLRDTWQISRAFLGRFTKDELRFIALECGLVEYLGEKAFAKLLDAKADKLIDGMLNTTGFNWAGRLPSAMTLDGKYGPPLAAPAFSEKD